jgi:CBS domain-containing protein
MTLVHRRCAPVFQETPLFIAWRILKISQSYALPVLNPEGHLIGIITDRDFFGIGKVGHKTTESAMGMGDDEDIWTWESVRNVMKVYYEVSDIDLPKGPVKKYMRKSPTTVFVRTKAAAAAQKMHTNNFRYLPIIDNKENLVNMVSDLDIISTLFDKL